MLISYKRKKDNGNNATGPLVNIPSPIQKPAGIIQYMLRFRASIKKHNAESEKTNTVFSIIVDRNDQAQIGNAANPISTNPKRLRYSGKTMRNNAIDREMDTTKVNALYRFSTHQ